MEMKFLTVVVAVVAILAPCSQALTCYNCGGSSGYDSTVAAPVSHCGLPFIDDGNLATVTCSGVCVTLSYYDGSTGSTGIARACSDAPVKDGCERTVSDTDGKIYWSCIKTCKTDKCNNTSGAATLLPVAMLLLLLAVFPAISRRILNM
jgi:hypothetical protein